jgi:hypothetical protein
MALTAMVAVLYGYFIVKSATIPVIMVLVSMAIFGGLSYLFWSYYKCLYSTTPLVLLDESGIQIGKKLQITWAGLERVHTVQVKARVEVIFSYKVPQSDTGTYKTKKRIELATLWDVRAKDFVDLVEVYQKAFSNISRVN